MQCIRGMILIPVDEKPTDQFKEARVTLNTQLSVRFNKKQRDYIQTQLHELQTNPYSCHFNHTASDVIRMLVDVAIRANYQAMPKLTDVEVG